MRNARFRRTRLPLLPCRCPTSVQFADRHTSGTVPNPLVGNNNPTLRDHSVFGTLCRVGIGMANRHRTSSTCRQIAGPALIRQKTAPQQVRQHGQRLIRHVLVDEGLLSGQGFGGTTRRLIVLLSFAGDDLRIQLRYGQEAILLLPVCRVVGLPQYGLSAGGVVAEIQPVEDSGTKRPTVDCPSGLSGINASEANTKDP